MKIPQFLLLEYFRLFKSQGQIDCENGVGGCDKHRRKNSRVMGDEVFIIFVHKKKFVDHDAKIRLLLSIMVFAGKLHKVQSLKMKAT